MTLSDIELYESLIARDEVDRDFRFHGSVLVLLASLLGISRLLFGRRRAEATGKPRRVPVEEPVVLFMLAGWGLTVVMQFLEGHRRIDRQVGK